MKKNLYFLCLSCLVTVTTEAQIAPGSVNSHLKLWIKANSVLASDTAAGKFNSWTYINDPSKAFTAAGAARPAFEDSSVNFNPSSRFDAAQAMDGPAGLNAPLAAGDDDYAVFAVWMSPYTTLQRIWSERALAANNDGVSLAISSSLYGDQAEIFPFTHTVTRPFTIDAWNVSELNLLNTPAGDLQISDNRNFNSPLVINTDTAAVPNGPAVRNLSNLSNRLGARNNPSDEPFNGNLAELIVYDSSVTDVNMRNRIFSYLAVKYGVNKTGNYIGWNGTSNFTFWDSTANSPYTNHVFGIGRDDGSGLYQARSNSMETGSGNGIGSFLNGNIVLSPYAPLGNLDYVMIGTDLGPMAEQVTDNPPSSQGSQRLGREWKVQRTGSTVGSVNLSFDLNGITISGNAGDRHDFRIMIDEDGDGNFSTGTTTLITPDTIISNRLMFTNLGLSNGVVFTFITNAAVALPVKWKSVAAIAKGNNVEIKWSVTNNDKGDNYVIEHSTDGSHFTKVGEVKNNVNIEDYVFTHQGVGPGKHYYRITQKDLDGKIIYSEIKVVTISAVQYVKILNNPVRTNFVEMDINTLTTSDATIQVWTVSGSKLSSLQTRVLGGSNRIKVPLVRNAAGVYVVKVIVAGEPFSFNFVRL